MRSRLIPHTRHIGRRGAVLILLGCIYILVGIGLIAATQDAVTSKGYSFPTSLFPLPFWAGIFFACGGLAVVSGTWPTGRDSWGFMCLTALASVWASFGFLTALLFEYPRGFLIGLSWTAICGILMIVSGMRGEHDD